MISPIARRSNIIVNTVGKNSVEKTPKPDTKEYILAKILSNVMFVEIYFVGKII